MIPGSRESLTGVSFDLGGTKTAVARIHRGKVVAYHQLATDGGMAAENLLQTLIDLASAVALESTDKIGVAVTGRVDADGNWYAVNQATLQHIDKVPVQSLLQKQFGRHVPVVNDALAGALGEQRYGAGVSAKRMVYLTVSTGVGAGIVLEGVPFTSPGGLAGHAGFTSSRYSTGQCGSGRIGTVESIASGNAIAHSAELAGHPDMTAEKVFAAHHANEAWATGIVSLSAAAIAELAADLVALLDIDTVVLGGGVGLAAGYCELVKNSINTMPRLFQVPVVEAALGSESVLIGALAKH